MKKFSKIMMGVAMVLLLDTHMAFAEEVMQDVHRERQAGCREVSTQLMAAEVGGELAGESTREEMLVRFDYASTMLPVDVARKIYAERTAHLSSVAKLMGCSGPIARSLGMANRMASFSEQPALTGRR